MEKVINFDMDGTLNLFYDVEGWLDDLINHNPRPYAIAKPSCNFSILARYLNKLINNGYKIRIISWLSKENNEEYNAIVAQTKIEWLNKHLPSVEFDEIIIVPYGTPKYTLSSGILFDDEELNRIGWGEGAYDVDNIIEILKTL